MSLFLRDLEMKEDGREEKYRAVVMNMLKKSKPINKICRYAECDESFVEEIKKNY